MGPDAVTTLRDHLTEIIDLDPQQAVFSPSKALQLLTACFQTKKQTDAVARKHAPFLVVFVEQTLKIVSAVPVDRDASHLMLAVSIATDQLLKCRSAVKGDQYMLDSIDHNLTIQLRVRGDPAAACTRGQNLLKRMHLICRGGKSGEATHFLPQDGDSGELAQLAALSTLHTIRCLVDAKTAGHVRAAVSLATCIVIPWVARLGAAAPKRFDAAFALLSTVGSLCKMSPEGVMDSEEESRVLRLQCRQCSMQMLKLSSKWNPDRLPELCLRSDAEFREGKGEPAELLSMYQEVGELMCGAARAASEWVQGWARAMADSGQWDEAIDKCCEHIELLAKDSTTAGMVWRAVVNQFKCHVGTD